MITDGEGGVNDEVGSFEGEHLLGDGFGDTGGAGALLDLDGYDLLGGEERSRAFVATLDPGLVDFVLEGRVEGLGPGELGLGIIVEPALETVFAEPEVSLSVLVADGTAEADARLARVRSTPATRQARGFAGLRGLHALDLQQGLSEQAHFSVRHFR